MILQRCLIQRLAFAVAFVSMVVALTPAHAVTIDWVTVGNPGNSNDSTGYGGVNYQYQIGKYDVTIQQYTDFLNAKAQTDPYSLWKSDMGANTRLNTAGIQRNGVDGSYTYSVMNNGGYSGNRPIVYVSWWDAARFANWVQNGQGSGDTETGAYTLSGATSGTAVAKNPGAQVYIPTFNEWYKAAYYDPTKAGTGGYWLYATRSDTVPGNVVGSGSNQANYRVGGSTYSVTQSSTYDFNQNYLTDVGAFSSSASFYGTFDQSGNVDQWNDLSEEIGPFRGRKGGSWASNRFGIDSQLNFQVTTATESNSIGFRLASVAVPEPSTCAMALAGLACGGYLVKRRRKRA